MSLGTDRVRLDFNVKNDEVIESLKKRTAQLIDDCDALKHFDGRLAALAMTAYEEACMWAVKLVTAK